MFYSPNKSCDCNEINYTYISITRVFFFFDKRNIALLEIMTDIVLYYTYNDQLFGYKFSVLYKDMLYQI